MMRIIWEENISKPSYRAVMKLRLERGTEYNKTQDQTMALASGSPASCRCQPGTRTNMSPYSNVGLSVAHTMGPMQAIISTIWNGKARVRGGECVVMVQITAGSCPINEHLWTKRQK